MQYIKLFLFFTLTIIYAEGAWTANSGGRINININNNFSLIYGGSGTSVKGDFLATGNSALFANKNDASFVDSRPVYMNDDNNMSALGSIAKNNKNSSLAPLSLPSYVKAEHIVWAGLFWQGQIHENANTTTQVDNIVRGWNTIHFKTPDGIIHEITAPIGNNDMSHSTYTYAYLRRGQFRYFYDAYVDVTNIVKNGGYTFSNNTFTVSNIMATDGYDKTSYMYFSHINEPTGAWYNNVHMGHFGGWSLVVVYDVDIQTMKDNQDVKYKNISIYNGFDQFLTWGNNGTKFERTIHLSGFRTPSNGTISSKLLFFGGGGDYSMRYDTLQIEDGNTLGTYVDLTNSRNVNDQKFNGTFTNLNGDILSNKSYFQGMDLDIFNTSNMMVHAQTETNIKFGVVKHGYCDQVFPQVLAFSTELYMPKLCYDYSVRMGDYIRVPSTGREINASKISDLPLNIKILLRSQEADFDLLDTRMKLDFTSLTGPLGINPMPNDVKVSPPNINAYLHVETNSTTGLFPIGRGVLPDTSAPGGLIHPLESNYAKLLYDFASGHESLDAKFDITLETKINFAGSNVPYTLSTKGTIEPCPVNAAYDPIWNIFNVERTDSYRYKPASEAYLRYPLYTQITGRNYEVSVVRYNAEDLNEIYKDKNDTVAEIEIIDAGSFDNNSSVGYDSICEEPAALGKTNHGKFINFNDTNRIDINIPTDIEGYDNHIALENAAFRIWVLSHEVNATTGEREIIHHNCTSVTGNCFRALYSNTVSAYDTDGLCSGDCTSSDDLTCYKCMKKYFATPVCSRDNFSVRPDGFRIAIDDNDESTTNLPVPITLIENDNNAATDPSSPIPFTLAAGYKYPFEVNATLFSTGEKSIGYYNTNFHAKSDITIVQSSKTSGTLAAMEFLQQSDPCADKAHRSLGFRMINSKIDNKIFLPDAAPDDIAPRINAGEYRLWIVDANWTIVDQAISPKKPVFNNRPTNDCIVSQSNEIADKDGKIGCLTSSIVDDNSNYRDLYLYFHPYKFDLNSITFHTRPNDSNDYLYMNNLYNDTQMAAKLEGNITALSRSGNMLSNFTKDCAAQNVLLWLDREMLPVPENDINDSKHSRVFFQQGLNDINGIMTIQDTSSNTDMNASLAATNFTNFSDLNGSAVVDLYYNFQKPYATTVNPVDVNFTQLNGASPAAASHTHMLPDYVPDGNVSINESRWYYFAKVVPADGTNGKQEYGSTVTTTMSVKSYCDTAVVPCSTLPGFATTVEEPVGTEGWYRMIQHLSSNGDGQINSIAVTNGITGVSISPNTNITFDTNGTSSTITIIYPTGSPRPVHPVFTITPDEWLKYDNNDPTGLPDFVINFLSQGLRWKGKGETGHVIETEPSTQSSGRLNW